MIHNDRRHFKRYLVNGTASILPAPEKSEQPSLELLNVGRGGIMVLSGALPAIGSELSFRFTVEGYNAELHANGQVLRNSAGTAAIRFLEEPEGIDDLILWLDATMMSSLL